MNRIITVILILFSICSFGQVKKLVKLGDKSYQNGEFYGSTQMYLKAWEEDSTYVGLIYKLGLSYKGYQNHEKALGYFKRIELNPELQIKHPDYLFQLAEVLKSLAKYEEAKTYYAKSLRVNRDTRSLAYLKAKYEVKVYPQVLKLLKDTVDVKVENLGTKINSPGAEYYSVWLNDSVILYSSKKAKQITIEEIVEDPVYRVSLFIGNINDSVWKELTVVGSKFKNESFLDGCLGINDDFYFSFQNEEGNYQIGKTKLIGRYDSIIKYELDSVTVISFSETDYLYNYRNPFVFEKGGKKYLMFSSNQPGGKGGMDLWYAEFKKGTWSAPKNLGTKINSLGDEIGPHFNSKTGELFFASNWHTGLGGFDMFKASGAWKRPTGFKNLGIPFNTSLNEMYYSPKDSLNGQFTSSRKGSVTDKDAACCNDLYAYEFPKPKVDSNLLAITNYLSKDSVMKRLERLVKEFHVTLYFHNDRPNPNNWDTITPYTYMETYNAYLDSLPTYFERNALGKSGADSLLALAKTNMFFDNYVHKGVADLKVFLAELIKELDEGQKILLTVKGYASPLAKSDYNVNLTLRRINSLQNYLRRYPGDVFSKYLDETADNGGVLRIEKVPFGEVRSDTTVSDNYYNTRRSVYSKEASLERKIEIINLTLIEDSIAESEFPMDLDSTRTTYDLGILDTTVFEWRFDLQNKTDKPMKIVDIDPGCHCVQPNRTNWELQPGETEPLDLKFDLTPYKGKIGRSVVLKMDDGSKKELILLMEVPE